MDFASSYPVGEKPISGRTDMAQYGQNYSTITQKVPGR